MMLRGTWGLAALIQLLRADDECDVSLCAELKHDDVVTDGVDDDHLDEDAVDQDELDTRGSHCQHRWDALPCHTCEIILKTTLKASA